MIITRELPTGLHRYKIRKLKTFTYLQWEDCTCNLGNGSCVILTISWPVSASVIMYTSGITRGHVLQEKILSNIPEHSSESKFPVLNKDLLV
jgi:hypothetical protein